MIFDSHCHPQFPQYDADREEMIKQTLDEGVFMICVGTDLETSKQAIELAQKHDGPPSPEGFGRAGIWATVGQHPSDVESRSMNQESWSELIQQPKVVAIGEIGLDYYRTVEQEKKEEQKKVFEQFVNLAIKFDKPLVVHTRDAGQGSEGRVFKDLFDILSAVGGPASGGNVHLRGVIHSCTATIPEATKFLDLGFYLGFNGIITFPPSRKATDGQVRGMYDDLVRYVPLDRILVETDAPFLAPLSRRGKRNEPLYIKEVIKKLAELKGVSEESIIEHTFINTTQLFGISAKD